MISRRHNFYIASIEIFKNIKKEKGVNKEMWLFKILDRGEEILFYDLWKKKLQLFLEDTIFI